jgi:hypothetical protein
LILAGTRAFFDIVVRLGIVERIVDFQIKIGPALVLIKNSFVPRRGRTYVSISVIFVEGLRYTFTSESGCGAV